MADAKRLAKNTLLMYVRMILIMIVSIYTSRVVLDKLGIDDYGLYNAVGSIVAMINFLNVTLSTSTSRFLAYDIGHGDEEKLQITFSTSFYCHLLLAIIIVVLLETIGLWYMDNKFVIPDGREWAVHIIFHISVLTAFIGVIQVPYTASIIAHENMDIYAYVGIADVFLRLGIVYLLSLAKFDKLIIYASLIAFVHVLIFLLYYISSRLKYSETKLTNSFSRDTFKGMMGFTGWTAIANFSNTMVVQGATVLLNLFFAPTIIATKALANQITNAVMQFVNNFRVALNPQIIKSYAAEEFDEFKKWSLRSTVISGDLMLVLGLPCMVSMEAILNLWLVEVPPLAVEFTQLAILSQIIGSISSSTYIPFVASGKLKLNAMWGTVTSLGYFFALYICFKLGADALWVQWLYLALMLLSVLWLRPWLLHKEIGFTYAEIYRCIWDCFKPLIFAGLFSVGLMYLFSDSLYHQVILFVLVFILSCTVVWFCLEHTIRTYITTMFKLKLLRK